MTNGNIYYPESTIKTTENDKIKWRNKKANTPPGRKGAYMKKRGFAKKLVIGVLLVVTLMGTVAAAQARQVGPTPFGFEF